MVSLLLVSFAHAGPFDLKPGMTVEDVNKVGASRKVNGFTPLSKYGKGGHEVYSHNCFFKSPPGQLRGPFKILRTLIDEKMGLIAIETEGYLSPKEGAAKYAEVVKTLTSKYGKPSGESIEKLTRTSTIKWPTGKKSQGIIDLSVSLQKIFGTDKLFIRYWFVPKSFVDKKNTEAKAKEKAEEKLKGLKELEDL